MTMEWLRADDSTDVCWACFMVYDDRVDVLAVIGPTERIDRSMAADAARTVWNELPQRGWHRANDEEIDQYQMSHRRLRRIAYERR
jgi:hypothetical protein